MVARRAHNPKVVGSNPPPATIAAGLGQRNRAGPHGLAPFVFPMFRAGVLLPGQGLSLIHI